jgi:hypothetical protein
VDCNENIAFPHPTRRHKTYTKCLAFFSPQGKFFLPIIHLENISSGYEETFSIEDLTDSLN